MRVLSALACVTLCVAALPAQPPIIFVHGNGDHAGLWDSTIWRFESNGYPDRLLFAVDLPNPLASSRFNVGEQNRSTPEEQTAALAGNVARVLMRTGAKSVVLVGSSRGGMTIRNYLRFAGGAAHVSHAILRGSPNHGVFALAQLQPETVQTRATDARRLIFAEFNHEQCGRIRAQYPCGGPVWRYRVTTCG